MNYLILMAIFLSGFGCTIQSIHNDDLVGINATAELEAKEITFLFGAELHLRYVNDRLFELYQEKSHAMKGVEQKQRGAVNTLENVQQEIELLENYREYLVGVSPPPGFRAPPRPPKGCLDNGNCNPQIALAALEGILTTEEIRIVQLEVVDGVGRPVPSKTRMGEDPSGNTTLLIASELRGSGKLNITIDIKGLGEVTTFNPIYVN